MVFWAAATVLSGFATSYLWLLLARVALGVVTATTGPTVASLTGDCFPAGDRGRVYGLIQGGDLLGSGFGYLVSGDLSSLTTWRVAFWWLAIPSLALAWVVYRLPQPAGRHSRIRPGRNISGTSGKPGPASGDRPLTATAASHPRQAGADGAGLADREVRRAGVDPRPDLVLRTDPTNCSIWWAERMTRSAASKPPTPPGDVNRGQAGRACRAARAH